MHRLRSLSRFRYLAEILALLGALVYLLQAITLAHQLPSTLDEGAYLYKGYQFLLGNYSPFQDYGFWTNKMPLAFLIPGWVQSFFGAGIRTARYFSIACGLFMLLGFWITARRLSNRWWAAGVVWMFALNNGLIGLYSQALSQIIIACLFTWSLVCLLGNARQTGLLALGAFLSGVIVMTRHNMFPVVFFLLLYVYWEYGWKKGGISTIAAFAPIVGLHALYWPKILILWMFELPDPVFLFTYPFFHLFIDPYTSLPTSHLAFLLQAPTRLSAVLGDWAGAAFAGWSTAVAVFAALPRIVTDVLTTPPRGISIVSEFARIFSFWDGLRYYFTPIFGTLCVWLFAPKPGKWRSRTDFRAVLVLSVLFLVLFGMHAWASLGKSYCVSCFGIYLAFFAPLGIFILIIAYPSLETRLGFFRQALAGIITLIYATGMAFAAHQSLEFFLRLPVPRVRDFQLQGGMTELWRLLTNKFGIEYDTLKWIIPTVSIAFLTFLLIALIVLWVKQRQRHEHITPCAGFTILFSLLVIGTLLTPTDVFGNANAVDCGGDVIASYERAGAVLAENIPPDSLVFWRGGLSAVPLLYIPQARVFPPQINNYYSYIPEGAPDYLRRRGYWDNDLLAEWLTKADFLLVDESSYNAGFADIIDTEIYRYVTTTPFIINCRSGTNIYIYKRLH